MGGLGSVELQLALLVVSRVASSFTSGVTHGAFRCVASVGEPACATLCNHGALAARCVPGRLHGAGVWVVGRAMSADSLMNGQAFYLSLKLRARSIN